MGNGTFLLVFNFVIALSFATAFLALGRRSEVVLGRWCAAGFLSAAATVSVEAFAFAIPSVRLVSTLSFGTLMLAIALIAAGLSRHYRPKAAIGWLFAIAALATIANPLLIFDLRRGSWQHSLAYQLPFVAMLLMAAAIVLAYSRRRAIDIGLVLVLAFGALQFVLKAVISIISGEGPGVRDYLDSVYLLYSQTAVGIASLLLGLMLVGLLMVDVMAATTRRLQRDPLSGMLNRAAFMDEATRMLNDMPPAAHASLVMCDLDHFKSINDRFGHAAGDEVIRSFGRTVTELVGERGLCGRLGGEEFCIFMPDTGIAATRARIEAIRAHLAATEFDLVPSGIQVTASFGAAITRRTETLDGAIQRADLALYRMKAEGRDGYRFANLALSPGERGGPRGASTL